MYYINKNPDENGYYGNPRMQWSPDCLMLPDELLSDYLAAKGFVIVTEGTDKQEGIITALGVAQEALDAYNASTQPDVSVLRSEKLSEISDACRAAILAGVDVEFSDGTTSHFSLEETDQINLTTAYAALQAGATEYPYHADGQLCRMYPAADIAAISQAAASHKLYHLTYCNHLMAWAKRVETADELAAITYGAELPEDLAANMQEVLADAAAS